MFCRIWLLGGGGSTGGAEAAGCGGLEGAGEGGVDGTREDGLVSGGASFCCGCFLGMVKLDLVTLSAPVTWIGPGLKADGGWAGDGPGFLDFDVLLWGVAGFFCTFELLD